MEKESSYILTGECPRGVLVRYILKGDRLTVGRHGDICLHEPSVSREHAVLTWNGDAWRVTDVGSRNGTYVNGVSVQRKLIAPGDVVKFGRVPLSLVDAVQERKSEDTEIWDCATRTLEPTAARAFTGAGAQALIGRSEALKSAMKTAARAAKSNATVLLFGESGTGKELFARFVWEESTRKEAKFLPVHSGAIEPTLLASSLFGYEKGAFTGADKQKKGLFEEADGGTIFLDEIGEINAETQVKLLRVLQEGEFMRVGGTEPVKVDVRVICATNRDLKKAVAEGRFREDLYYRLNVIQIDLPPLRERIADIPDLVNHYVRQTGGLSRSVSAEAMSAMCRYKWPGNVRELKNTVERIVILSENDVIALSDLPAEIAASGGAVRESDGATAQLDRPAQPEGGAAPPAYDAVRGGGAPGEQESLNLEAIEKRAIVDALNKAGGNKSKAKELLGISRSALYEKLKKYGLE